MLVDKPFRLLELPVRCFVLSLVVKDEPALQPVQEHVRVPGRFLQPVQGPLVVGPFQPLQGGFHEAGIGGAAAGHMEGGETDCERVEGSGSLFRNQGAAFTVSMRGGPYPGRCSSRMPLPPQVFPRRPGRGATPGFPPGPSSACRLPLRRVTLPLSGASAKSNGPHAPIPSHQHRRRRLRSRRAAVPLLSDRPGPGAQPLRRRQPPPRSGPGDRRAWGPPFRPSRGSPRRRAGRPRGAGDAERPARPAGARRAGRRQARRHRQADGTQCRRGAEHDRGRRAQRPAPDLLSEPALGRGLPHRAESARRGSGRRAGLAGNLLERPEETPHLAQRGRPRGRPLDRPRLPPRRPGPAAGRRPGRAGVRPVPLGSPRQRRRGSRLLPADLRQRGAGAGDHLLGRPGAETALVRGGQLRHPDPARLRTPRRRR